MRRFGYFFLPMVVFIPLAALALMLLWNWLLPGLFAIGTITFWQALGLLVLLRLLIGPRFGFPFYRRYGWYGRHRRGQFWRKRMYEKWKNMSDEEKERFRHAFHYRHCYPYEYSSEATSETQEETN